MKTIKTADYSTIIKHLNLSKNSLSSVYSKANKILKYAGKEYFKEFKDFPENQRLHFIAFGLATNMPFARNLSRSRLLTTDPERGLALARLKDFANETKNVEDFKTPTGVVVQTPYHAYQEYYKRRITLEELERRISMWKDLYQVYNFKGYGD